MGFEKPKVNPYVLLRHIAAELPVGVTDNTQRCPFCNGGDNGDRGFTLSRTSESEAKYCCHRATCDKAGRIACWGFRLEPDVRDSPKPERKFTPRVYSGNTSELDRFWSSEISTLYGIRPSETAWANWRVDTESNRLACPVYGPNYQHRGYELRQSKISRHFTGPKTLHYREIQEVWMGWYRTTQTGPVILVEDVISALKASRYFQASYLLGSHISLDHILEAIEVSKGETIYVALDKDATDKAVKFIQKWKFVTGNLVLYPLSKDLKYMIDEEIKSIIRR